MRILDIMQNNNIPTHYKERYRDEAVWRDMADLVLSEISTRNFFKEIAVLNYIETLNGYRLPADINCLVSVGLADGREIEHYTISDGIIGVRERFSGLTAEARANLERAQAEWQHWDDTINQMIAGGVGSQDVNLMAARSRRGEAGNWVRGAAIILHLAEQGISAEINISYHPIRRCELNFPATEIRDMVIPITPNMLPAFISGMIWACSKREFVDGNEVMRFRRDFDNDLLILQNVIKTPRAKQAKFTKAAYSNPFM